MTTLSFPKILSAVTAISYFRGWKKDLFWQDFVCAVNGLITVTHNSPGNHGPFDLELSKIFYIWLFPGFICRSGFWDQPVLVGESLIQAYYKICILLPKFLPETEISTQDGSICHLKYSSKNLNWSLIVDQLSTSFFVVSFWVCSNQVAAKLTEIIWTGPILINLRDAPFRLWNFEFFPPKIFWKPPSSIHILLIFMNEHESWFIMSQYINF